MFTIAFYLLLTENIYGRHGRPNPSLGLSSHVAPCDPGSCLSEESQRKAADKKNQIFVNVVM